MARPSKLTDKQRSEIQRRHVGGETTRSLAKAYKVSQATVATIVSGRTDTLKALASSIVRDEMTLQSLPVSDQIIVQTQADRLRGISEGLATAAHHNANVAARFAKMADRRSQNLQKMDDDDPQADLFSEKDNIAVIRMLVDTATQASAIGSNLLNANKNKSPEGEMTLEQLVIGERVTGS
jgi:hypothetical protein